MSDQRSDSYTRIHIALKEFKQKLVELSALDLSKIHISHEWSWMPYVKDHLDFLIEQVEGLSENLQDSPPPVTPEEVIKKTFKDSE